MKLIAVCTTVAEPDDARRIAEACVTERLAACVQLSRIDSVFEWAGALQHESEVRLVLKTTDDRAAALMDRVRALHPYTLSAVFALGVAEADAAYAAWVHGQTRPAGA